jgi:hypothetical protein
MDRDVFRCPAPRIVYYQGSRGRYRLSENHLNSIGIPSAILHGFGGLTGRAVPFVKGCETELLCNALEAAPCGVGDAGRCPLSLREIPPGYLCGKEDGVGAFIAGLFAAWQVWIAWCRDRPLWSNGAGKTPGGSVAGSRSGRDSSTVPLAPKPLLMTGFPDRKTP